MYFPKFTNILMNEFKGFFVRFLTEKEINELLKIVNENDNEDPLIYAK